MSDFRRRLRVAADKGGFAWAYSKLVVHNDVRDFAELVSEPSFDIAAVWDDDLILQHIEYQKRQRR